MPFNLYLASSSPRRLELLAQIGVPVEQVLVDVDESLVMGESPEHYVQRLALAKASAGWAALKQQNRSPQPVLGADTTVVFDQHILGKPVDRDDGIRMLNLLSGNTHRVLSSVAIVQGESAQTRLSCTEVSFRSLSSTDIERYWASGEPCDKAGAYGIQGLGGALVTHISGSYTGVVGLPLAETVELLAAFGIEIWQS